MRFFLVIDETSFYHPDFVADFLRRTPDEIVGAARVTKVPPKHNIEEYLRRNWRRMRFAEMAELAMLKYGKACLDVVVPNKKTGRFYSIRSVYETFGVDYFDVCWDINKPEYLERIRASSPDVIVSSNSLIFKNELLSIPRVCCVNRHSALLPSNGGLRPVFQAYRKGEPYTGVTVHTMEPAIDKGVVLAQRSVPIEKEATLAQLHERCYALSADVLLDTLEKVRNNDFSPLENDFSPSYFSFPTSEHWGEFRSRGGRFI